MWQRKQTIYLIIATLLMIVHACFYNDGIMLGMDIATALFSVASIFMYSNRKKQIYFCRVGTVFIVLWMAYYCYERFIAKAEGLNADLLSGPFMPIVAYIMLRLAIKGIQHDEELIRSADRIR